MPPPGGVDYGDGELIPPLPNNPYAAQTPTAPPMNGGAVGSAAHSTGGPQYSVPGANAGGGPSIPNPDIDSGFFQGIYDAGVAASGGMPPGGLPMPGMGFGSPVMSETSGMGAPHPPLNDTSSPGAPRAIGNNGMGAGGYLQSQQLAPPMPGPGPGGGQGQIPVRRFPRATSLIPSGPVPSMRGR